MQGDPVNAPLEVEDSDDDEEEEPPKKKSKQPDDKPAKSKKKDEEVWHASSDRCSVANSLKRSRSPK